VRDLLAAAAAEDEAAARELCATWEPREDGGARLYRQLSRRGTDGFAVGEVAVAGDRAVVQLVKDERRLGVYVEGGRIVAVRQSPAWEAGWLADELPAQLAFTSLDRADAAEISQATTWIDRLIRTNGGLDEAPVLFRARIKAGAVIHPTPTGSRRLGDRYAVSFRVVDGDWDEDRWFFFAGERFLRMSTGPAVEDFLRPEV
jgi:hypothetical protein